MERSLQSIQQHDNKRTTQMENSYGGDEMSEYIQLEGNEHLIGKRARIKKPEDYCSFLWGCTGTIQKEVGGLYLKFDTPAKRNKEDNFPCNGIYLTRTSFELL